MLTRVLVGFGEHSRFFDAGHGYVFSELLSLCTSLWAVDAFAKRVLLTQRFLSDARIASNSPEIELSSDWPRSLLKSNGRPIRATRGKRTSLDAEFIDSTSLKVETDSEGDNDGDEDARHPKKRRLQPTLFTQEEHESEARHLFRSASSSSSGSHPQPGPEKEPEPGPWELRYYPRILSAVEKFNKMLGTPPPDTDNLDIAIKAMKDPTNMVPNTRKLIVTLPLPYGIVDKNASFETGKVGFMDFPGELRNQIYSLVFKKKDQIHFRSRIGFPHSAAFLRVNKAVHNEARIVLYGENRFVFEQSFNKVGTYFDQQWQEVNYAYIRKFLDDIGPENTGLITNIGLKLEDATPSGHPGTGMDARRFENNKDLYWILKYLGRYGMIEKLKLGFAGRRNLQFYKGEAAFLYALKGVKTDQLNIGDPDNEGEDMSNWDRRRHSKLDPALKDALEGLMVRPMPLKSLDPRLDF